MSPKTEADAVYISAASRRADMTLLAPRDIQDGVPHELHQPIERVLTQALDVAVPSMLGELGFIETRADAIGLHAPGAQLGEIGRAGDHAGNGDRVGVEAALRGFERSKHFRVKTAGRRRWPARRLRHDFDCRVAYDSFYFREEFSHVFVRQRADVEHGFGVRWN